MKINLINSDPDSRVKIFPELMINLNLTKEFSKKLSRMKTSTKRLLKVESKHSKREMKWSTTLKKVSKTFSINFTKESQQRTNFKVSLMNKLLTAFIHHQTRLKDKINF